jgi:enoyl-CoA hydratase
METVMDQQSFKALLFERKDNVLTITMNNPAKLNAVGPEMHDELVRAFRDLEEERDIDVVVLTGAGKAFSAGGEVGHNLTVHDDQHRVTKEISQAKKIVLKLLDCEQLLIARINGDAIGFGATLALFCDITIAIDTARISDAHLKVGLVAGDGGAIIWPQLIGYARAKQYLLTGDMLTAKEAQQMGLINFAVPQAEFDPLVEKWVKRFATGPRKATKWSKHIINIGLKQQAAAMLDASMAYEGLSLLSDDLVEAVHAFQAKRKPEFRGR